MIIDWLIDWFDSFSCRFCTQKKNIVQTATIPDWLSYWLTTQKIIGSFEHSFSTKCSHDNGIWQNDFTPPAAFRTKSFSHIRSFWGRIWRRSLRRRWGCHCRKCHSDESVRNSINHLTRQLSLNLSWFHWTYRYKLMIVYQASRGAVYNT